MSKLPFFFFMAGVVSFASPVLAGDRGHARGPSAYFGNTRGFLGGGIGQRHSAGVYYGHRAQAHRGHFRQGASRLGGHQRFRHHSRHNLRGSRFGTGRHGRFLSDRSASGRVSSHYYDGRAGSPAYDRYRQKYHGVRLNVGDHHGDYYD